MSEPGITSEPADGTPTGDRPPTPLLEPREGVPPVLRTAAEFADAATRLTNGEGPVAVDTERASGYRYSQRAYLIQIRRTGSGSFLLDPIDEPAALGPVIDALAGPEWILHAADQDLPCLRELGFRAESLFDTELAGRLLGLTKVNLAAMVARFLGLGLEKGHGAADWSRRPLPADWLNYAALDVEVLIELRDAMDDALRIAGKQHWAQQEFAAILTRPEPTPRTDRWRRTTNIHTIKSTRALAAVRELWITREQLAAQRDVAPGRVLPDSAIITAATAAPTTVAELTKLPVFGGPRQRKQGALWISALLRARDLPADELPARKAVGTGLPPVNRWDQRNPDAAARAATVRPLVKQIAEANELPTENLLSPELLRQLCWDGIPEPVTAEAVASRLADGGARPWQRALTAEAIAAGLVAAADPGTDTPEPAAPPN